MFETTQPKQLTKTEILKRFTNRPLPIVRSVSVDQYSE